MSTEAIETVELEGLTLFISPDPDPLNPRTEWDNACTMMCWHDRYNLGDVQANRHADPLGKLAQEVGVDFDHIERWEEWYYNKYRDNHTAEFNKCYNEKLLAECEKLAFMLPLYLYEHSGMTMSTGPFSCPWDSGQVGVIFITKEKARKEFPSITRFTKKQRTRIYDLMRAEVECYDQYLRGDVYGYNIEDEDGTHYDSCWGFFGIECCREEGMSSLRHSAAKRKSDLGGGI